MNYARKIISVVNKAANRAVRQNRAFEIGKIASPGNGGSLNIDVPGMGEIKQVSNQNKASVKPDQQVLLVRLGGDHNRMIALTRAPYVLGGESTVTYNISH